MRLITNKLFTEEEFNKRLRFKTEPVERITDNVRTLCLDMLEFMYRINAIGLAANQVGLKARICVLDPAWLFGRRLPVVLVNPEIVEHGDELYSSPEGCLSLVDFTLEVPRFSDITVRYLGLDGKEHLIKDKNSLLASVLQHEIDHLDGYLMHDRVVEGVEIPYKKED